MTYCTIAGLVKRFGLTEIVEISSRNDDEVEALPVPGENARIEDNFGPKATEAILSAIQDASELIDGYLAGRYQVPLTCPVALVQRWCADAARFYLHYAPPEPVLKNYELVLSALKAVAAGTLRIPAGENVEAPTEEGGGVSFAATSPMFTPDSMKGF